MSDVNNYSFNYTEHLLKSYASKYLVCFYQLHNVTLLHTVSPVQCSPFIAGPNVQINTKTEQLFCCINRASACNHQQRRDRCL